MQQKRPRWFQFSLRTLITLMLVVGTGFGWLATRLVQARQQKEAVDALIVLGCTISYDYQLRDGNQFAGNLKPARTFWRKQLGDDFFDRVVAVDRGSMQISDEEMQYFDSLPYLEHLNLSGARITDDGIAYLRNLTELKSLDVWGSKISDEGMTNLRRMTKLEELWLGTAKLDGPGLIHLQEMSSLRVLYLSHTKVDNAGLAHISHLESLQVLTLFGTPVTDDAVATLSRLTGLTYLLVGNTEITAQGKNQLRRALPECKIVPEKR